jgi:hypothetical protein
VNLQLSQHGFSSAKIPVTTGKSSSKEDVVTLEPYGVLIGQLLK